MQEDSGRKHSIPYSQILSEKMQWESKRAVMPMDSKGFKIPASRNERGSLAAGVVWRQLDKWILNLRAGQKKKGDGVKCTWGIRPLHASHWQGHSVTCNSGLCSKAPESPSGNLQVFGSSWKETQLYFLSAHCERILLFYNSHCLQILSLLLTFTSSSLSRKHWAWQSH